MNLCLPANEIAWRWVNEFAPKYLSGNYDNDGSFELAREGSNYCYVWCQSLVDMDFEMFYLLDVRTNDEERSDDWMRREVRQFLFVADVLTDKLFEGDYLDPGRHTKQEWHYMKTPFGASMESHRFRLWSGLRWFADQVVPD